MISRFLESESREGAIDADGGDPAASDAESHLSVEVATSENTTSRVNWFATKKSGGSGLRIDGGGVHLSKTMMLPELAKLLAELDPLTLLAPGDEPRRAIERAALQENVLGKHTERGRATTLKKLAELYGLYERPRITRLLLTLWPRSSVAHPQLAILCALARDPLLRETASLMLDARPGEPVGSAMVSTLLERHFPDRFAPVTLAALAQRSAATWSQAGLLGPPPGRRRMIVSATLEAVLYAAILAREAGFRGQAIMESPWIRILDASADHALQLLRRAQAEDLVRLNIAGHVFELEPSSRLSAMMGGEGATLL